MEFPRQEYWSMSPFPFSGELPNSGIESHVYLHLLHWQPGSLPAESPGNSHFKYSCKTLCLYDFSLPGTDLQPCCLRTETSYYKSDTATPIRHLMGSGWTIPDPFGLSFYRGHLRPISKLGLKLIGALGISICHSWGRTLLHEDGCILGDFIVLTVPADRSFCDMCFGWWVVKMSENCPCQVEIIVPGPDCSWEVRVFIFLSWSTKSRAPCLMLPWLWARVGVRRRSLPHRPQVFLLFSLWCCRSNESFSICRIPLQRFPLSYIIFL